MNTHLSKENLQITDKHMKRWPIPLIIMDNTDQSCKEISSPICQNDYYQKNQRKSTCENVDKWEIG